MNKTITTRLAVVRYVPDPVRDEPRNVGVIAWRDGQASARFLGEDEVGELDKRRIPPRLIADRQTYAQWVTFWRTQLSSSVEDPVRREQVTIRDDRFLEALANATRGGFDVRLGAEAIVAEEWDLERVVRETFERLVDTAQWDSPLEPAEPPTRPHHRQLAWDACRALMKRHYKEHHDFMRDYQVTGRTGKGNDVPAVFDIGIPTHADLIAAGRLLLVDAVSLTASGADVSDVVDRARAIATKAIETIGRNKDTLVRAIVSNGRSTDSDAGRYAIQILQDDGGVEPITIEELVELVDRL